MTPDEMNFASAFASSVLEDICPRCGCTLSLEEKKDNSDTVLECRGCGMIFGHNLSSVSEFSC